MNFLKSNKAFYILCPRRAATGGPELLHQLCFHLNNDFHAKAYMCYYPFSSGSGMHEEYKKYGNPEVSSIEDEGNNYIISPEVYESMRYLGRYSKINKIVWFLSVDNYYKSRVKFYNLIKNNIIYQKFVSLKLLKDYPVFNEKLVSKIKISNDVILKNSNLILSQSKYAHVFLKRNGYESLIVSDYINDDFFKIKDKVLKKNIVAYNYNKGKEFTKKIIDQGNDIEFVPINNMKRAEVINVLKKSKVYIDFGNHPGKDRIPRESALLDCCVITNKKGSALYYEDVPINSEFKFEDSDSNIPVIINKIKECFDQYDNQIKKYFHYKKNIMQEKITFLKEIEKLLTIVA